MPIYKAKGKWPETGEPVMVELGWSETSGYFFGVDSVSGRELRSAVEIRSLPELIALTGDLGIWDRRVFNAMRDLPVVDYLIRHPGTPAAKIVTAVR